jgi:hypothetical protein
MKHATLLCTLLAVGLSSHIAYAMSQPIGDIEKQILLREFNRIGKEAAIQQIQQAEGKELSHSRIGYTLHPCFSVVFKLRPDSNDHLANFIIQTIREKEEKESYRPKQTIEKDGLIVQANNRVDNNTLYWHEVDHDGKYIQIKSHFFENKVC